MSGPVRPTVREVLARLEADGTLPPSPSRLEAAHAALVQEAARDRDTAPWFVRLLVAVGSLVAMGLLLGFLFAAEVVDGPTGAWVLGGVLVAAALGLWRALPGPLAGPALLTLSLAGEALVIGGTLAEARRVATAAGVAAALELALLALVPDRLHRFLSTVAVAAALATLLYDVVPGWSLDVLAVGLAVGLHALLLQRPRLEAGRAADLVAPVAAGLAVSLFGLLAVGLALKPRVGDVLHPLGPLATVGLAAVALLSSRAMATEPPLRQAGPALALLRGVLVLLAALTLRSPGLLASLGVLGLAFHRRDRVLLGLAVVSVLAFGAAFYFQLSLTLLAKAGVLVGSGGVLLGARVALARLSPAAQVRA